MRGLNRIRANNRSGSIYIPSMDGVMNEATSRNHAPLPMLDNVPFQEPVADPLAMVPTNSSDFNREPSRTPSPSAGSFSEDRTITASPIRAAKRAKTSTPSATTPTPQPVSPLPIQPAPDAVSSRIIAPPPDVNNVNEAGPSVPRITYVPPKPLTANHHRIHQYLHQLSEDDSKNARIEQLREAIPELEPLNDDRLKKVLTETRRHFDLPTLHAFRRTRAESMALRAKYEELYLKGERHPATVARTLNAPLNTIRDYLKEFKTKHGPKVDENVQNIESRSRSRTRTRTRTRFQRS